MHRQAPPLCQALSGEGARSAGGVALRASLAMTSSEGGASCFSGVGVIRLACLAAEAVGPTLTAAPPMEDSAGADTGAGAAHWPASTRVGTMRRAGLAAGAALASPPGAPAAAWPAAA
jgi:hypothetical protein